MVKVKGLLPLVLMVTVTINALDASDVSINTLNEIEPFLLVHNGDSHETLRKINISQFLHNLAATIYNVGQAATADTPKEKQRAAFGIVTSLLQLAADASAKKEQKNHGELPLDADSEMIETKTVDIVMDVLELVDASDVRSVQESELILNEMQKAVSRDERRQLITEKLRTQGGRAAVMGASLSVLKRAVEKRIASVVQALNEQDTKLRFSDDSPDGEETEEESDETPQQQPAPDTTSWWDKIVTFTTQNSLVTAIHHGFEDIYNYIHNFFTQSSDAGSDSAPE